MKKLYFNGKSKECLNGHIKTIDQFYRHGNKVTNKDMSAHYRPYCKECHNQINIRRILEKKRNKFPNSFWDCDRCDHIVSVKNNRCNKCGAMRQ